MASLCGAREKLKITARERWRDGERERGSSTNDEILNTDSELHAASLGETSALT